MINYDSIVFTLTHFNTSTDTDNIKADLSIHHLKLNLFVN